VAVNRQRMRPASCWRLSTGSPGGTRGTRDIVENRFVGMKSRGVYETPASPCSTSHTGGGVV